MSSHSHRGFCRLKPVALIAPLPVAALAWRAATCVPHRRPATGGVPIVVHREAVPDEASANGKRFPLGQCQLRTALGPVTCEFGNRTGPDANTFLGTAYIRFRWRTGSRWATNYLEPRNGYAFLDHRGVRVEATKDAQGGAVILVNVAEPYATTYCLLTTAVRLNCRSTRPRVLGQFEDGEEPSGYIASPDRGTILFWSSHSDPNDCHVAPHTFSFAEFRIEEDRWLRLWSQATRRKYNWNLEEESRYLRDRLEDPLQEIGRRWPAWWTEKWAPRSPRGVVRY
jgi:hypothetical protein